jgi:hypothetical protein
MIAKIPRTSSSESFEVSECPTSIIPPIIITPLMAFAPDISGVCSTEGTWDITSIPRNTDSAMMKIASL